MVRAECYLYPMSGETDMTLLIYSPSHHNKNRQNVLSLKCANYMLILRAERYLYLTSGEHEPVMKLLIDSPSHHNTMYMDM